jgi:MFS family permease
MVVFAFGNFLGPLLLGRLFDTVGRIPMISGTYLVAAGLTAVVAALFLADSLTAASFIALIALTFFVASAGASSAYLTVSEIFPMETRALAIALFFAVGTAVGGITGPALFGQLIHSGDPHQVAIGFFIGAAAMALGGIAELRYGVRAEGQALENIAQPLTAEEAEGLAPEPEPLSPENERLERERDDRIRARTARSRRRRLRPGTGPGNWYYSPGYFGTAGTSSRTGAVAAQDFDREIGLVARAVDENGELDRTQLDRLVGGRAWGPRRFDAALREAVAEGRVRRLAGDRFAPPRERR